MEYEKGYEQPICGCSWCESQREGVHLHQILEGFVVKQHAEINKTNLEIQEVRAENAMLRNLLKTVL